MKKLSKKVFSLSALVIIFGLVPFSAQAYDELSQEACEAIRVGNVTWMKNYFNDNTFKLFKLDEPCRFKELRRYKTPLVMAVHNEPMLDLILQNAGPYFDPDYYYLGNGWDGDGGSALEWAARLGLSSVFDKLLRAGSNPKSSNALLFEGAKSGSLKMFMKVLEHSQDFCIYKTKYCVLTAAIINGSSPADPERLELIRYLLSRKEVDVNALDYSDYSPLMRAAATGDIVLAQLLINSGADINQRSPSVDDALIVAIDNDQLPFLKFLIKNGANVNGSYVYAGEGVDLIDYAYFSEKLEIWKYLQFEVFDGTNSNKGSRSLK